jgi:hypothetical protein
MLRFCLMSIGFVVAALVVTGAVKTASGVVSGTDNPTNLQRNVSQEFSEAGLVVPAPPAGAAGGYPNGRAPVPGQSVPQGGDLQRQLQSQSQLGR